MGQVGGSVTSGSLGGGQANWEVVFSHSETFFFFPQVRNVAASLTWLQRQRKVSS